MRRTEKYAEGLSYVTGRTNRVGLWGLVEMGVPALRR